MRRTDLSSFNFDASENVLLFFERRHPIVWAVIAAALLAAFLLISASTLDPDWQVPLVRGKGSSIVALLALMPLALRAIVLAALLAYLAEALYRFTRRMYDRTPDFVIGPTGIADLNPWQPRALAWAEIREYRRHVVGPCLGLRAKSLKLSFAARRKPVTWMPQSLWDLMPALVTERTIDIIPQSVGLTEGGLLQIVERFAGRVAIRDRRVS